MARMGSWLGTWLLQRFVRNTDSLTRMGMFKAEEPPSALLFGHAALLSVRKNARRRAALFYLFAANKLEKYGIVRIQSCLG